MRHPPYSTDRHGANDDRPIDLDHGRGAPKLNHSKPTPHPQGYTRVLHRRRRYVRLRSGREKKTGEIRWVVCYSRKYENHDHD